MVCKSTADPRSPYGMIIDAVIFTRDKFSHVMSSASFKIPYVDFLGQVMKDT